MNQSKVKKNKQSIAENFIGMNKTRKLVYLLILLFCSLTMIWYMGTQGISVSSLFHIPDITNVIVLETQVSILVLLGYIGLCVYFMPGKEGKR